MGTWVASRLFEKNWKNVNFEPTRSQKERKHCLLTVFPWFPQAPVCFSSFFFWMERTKLHWEGDIVFWLSYIQTLAPFCCVVTWDLLCSNLGSTPTFENVFWPRSLDSLQRQFYFRKKKKNWGEIIVVGLRYLNSLQHRQNIRKIWAFRLLFLEKSAFVVICIKKYPENGGGELA